MKDDDLEARLDALTPDEDDVDLEWEMWRALTEGRLRVKYSEDQPRDELGRFGEGGGSESGSPADAAGNEVHVGDRVDIVDPIPNSEATEGTIVAITGGRVDVWQTGGTVMSLDPSEVRVREDVPRISEREARLLAERGGGFSYQPFTGTQPTTGFMVAGISEPVTVSVRDSIAARDAIVDFVDAHAEEFAANPNLYIGGWSSGGEVTIELAQNVDDRAEAAALGSDRNQVAIWDVEGGREIETGGTGEYRAASFWVPVDVYEAVIRSTLAEWKYSEDQPRDEAGRFGEGGASAGPLTTATTEASLTEKEMVRYEAKLEQAGVSREGVRAEIADRIKGADLARAAEWYPRAGVVAEKLGERITGKTDLASKSQGAAVLAALSPQSPWSIETRLGSFGNVNDAVRVGDYFRDHAGDSKFAGLSGRELYAAMAHDLRLEYSASPKDGADARNHDTVDHPNGVSMKAGEREIANAFAVLADGSRENIQSVLGELKTASFYNNIMDPGNTRGAYVTVDTHMLKSLSFSTTLDSLPKEGRQPSAVGMGGSTSYGSAGHIVIADAVRSVANELGVSPSTVQAAYWLQVQPETPNGWSPSPTPPYTSNEDILGMVTG